MLKMKIPKVPKMPKMPKIPTKILTAMGSYRNGRLPVDLTIGIGTGGRPVRFASWTSFLDAIIDIIMIVVARRNFRDDCITV